MIYVAVAVAIHVMAVVWWVGGVAFVTMTVIPKIATEESPREAFHRIEQRFAPQARIAVLLVGLSGIFLLWHFNAWSWYLHIHFWWLSAMTGYWLIFFIVLFLIEPFKLFKREDKDIPEQMWIRHLLWTHRVLLVAGLIVIGGAVFGTHGVG